MIVPDAFVSSLLRPETQRLFVSLFETLDGDVETCFKYIEPTIDNIVPEAQDIGIFSVELYRLHLDVCSALGSLLHQYYIKLIKTKDEPSIGDYYPLLTAPELDIDTSQVLSLRRNPDIKISPLRGWNQDTPPRWWTDHNKTKHTMSYSNYPKASLSNVAYSLGALYLTVHDKYLRSTNPINPRTFKPIF